MPTTSLPTAYPPGAVPADPLGAVPADPLRAIPAQRTVPAMGLDPRTGGGAGSAADYLLEQMPFRRMEQRAMEAAQPQPQMPALPVFDPLAQPAPEPVQLSEDELLRQTAAGTRTLGETVGDTLLAVGAGLAGLVEAAGGIASLVGLADPDNAVSRGARDVAEGFRSAQSEELQARRAIRDRAMAEAETAGGEFAAAVIGTFGTPSLLFDLLAEMAPGVGVSGLVGRGARAITARMASENIARATGVSAAVASNAVQQGGSVAAEVGNEMQGWDESQWMRSGEYAQRIETEDPEAVKADMIRRAMAEAFAGSSALTVAVAALPGGRAIERWSSGIPARTLASSDGIVRRIGQSGLARASLGFVGEGSGEAIEEGGGQYLGGLARQRVDPLVDPTEGAPGAAGLGFAGGGPLGGVAGYINRPAQTAPDQTPPEAEASADEVAPADVPPSPELPGLPPAGFTPDAVPDLPTGLGAMSAAERGRLFTRLNTDIAPINAALAEAGLFMRDENDNPIVDAEGNPVPFSFTAATFANDPQGVISTLGELGVDDEILGTLSDLAAGLEARTRAATIRAEQAAAATPATQNFIRALDDEGRAAFAQAMGWSTEDVQGVLDSPVVTDEMDLPQSFRLRVAEASRVAREQTRARNSAAVEAAWEAIRARDNEIEAARQEQEARWAAEERAAGAEEAFEADRERRLNELAASMPVIDGPGSFDPAEPAAEALFNRVTRGRRAPVIAEAQAQRMGDPSADSRLFREWRRGNTGAVRDLLRRAGRTGFLRDFEALVEQQRSDTRERQLTRQVATMPVIDGPGSFDPTEPAAEELYNRMTRNGTAPVFTRAQVQRMGDPAAEARFNNAWRRGHTSVVRSLLLGANRTTLAREFDAVVDAQRGTSTASPLAPLPPADPLAAPSVPPPPADPLAAPVQGDLFDALRGEAEDPKR